MNYPGWSHPSWSLQQVELKLWKEKGGIWVSSPAPEAQGFPFLEVTKPVGNCCWGQVLVRFQQDALVLLSQLRAGALGGGGGRRRTWQHLGWLALRAGGNNRGHGGHLAPFHLPVIPAINPSDQLELFSIDMFTREAHI